MQLSGMTSRVPKRVSFASAEYELGVITALLHDAGKTVSQADEGVWARNALTMAHELLGVELIHKPRVLGLPSAFHWPVHSQDPKGRDSRCSRICI